MKSYKCMMENSLNTLIQHPKTFVVVKMCVTVVSSTTSQTLVTSQYNELFLQTEPCY